MNGTVSVCGLSIPEPDFRQALGAIERELPSYTRAMPAPFQEYLSGLGGPHEQASAIYHHLVAAYLSRPPDRPHN